MSPRDPARRRGALSLTLFTCLGANVAHAAGSQLVIHAVDANTGAIGGALATLPLQEPQASAFDRVRVLAHGNQAYAAVLDSVGGELQVYALGAGNFGTRRAIYRLGFRASSLDVGGTSAAPWIVVHGEDTGSIRRFVLNADGTLGAVVSTTAGEWRDKSVFEAYPVGASWYYFGYDPFAGNGQVRRHTGEAVSNFVGWSLGWRTADYLSTGANTYRALYKFANHPGEDGGHLKIDRVSATGSILSTSYDGNIGVNYTALRFVTTTVNTLGGPAPRRFVVAYAGPNSGTVSMLFDGATLTTPGVSTLTSIGYSDFDSYAVGSTTYAIFVKPSGDPMLSASEVDNFADSLTAQLEGQVPGYSAGLSQYGRTLYRGIGGLVNVPNNTPMTYDSHVNVGSVGKLFTTATVLMLAEMGELDLDNPAIDYLPYADADAASDETYDYANMHPSMRFVTLRDLLTYTSGLGVGCTMRANDTLDCTPAFAMARDPALCLPNAAIPGDQDCDYAYHNSNYSILRDVIEHHTRQHTVNEMVDFAQDLWMSATAMPSATCLDPPGDAAYYIEVASCAEDWTGNEQGTTPSCAAGGWYLPGRDIHKFLEAVRNERIVGPELSTAWLDQGLVTVKGAETAMGWGPDGGTGSSCKSGGGSYDVGGMSARVCVLAAGAEAFLAFNTPKTCGTQEIASQVLSNAWQAR